jgi:[ribosomal protein S18]-alanine N-acetyltransferase
MKMPNLEREAPTKPDYKVSSMRTADIEAVALIEKRCNSLPWNPNAYITELGNLNAYYAVAKSSDGTVLGFGGIWVIMDELHITTLAVDKGSRGKKLGEKLLYVMIEEGIRRGATRATLEVREGNKVAQSLYHKYKFEDVAIRKAYYSDNGENAIIMWAEEISSPAYQQMLYGYQREFSV